MSDIKSAFVSRFGVNGMLIEADYSQLEVVALAFLSQDRQLISDIKNKVDIHAINAEALFGAGFTEKQRKLAKRLSFQLQYGSGAANMAKKNDIPINVAKKFIRNYYTRYPQVEKWQEATYNAVKKSRVPSAKRSANNIPVGEGTYTSVTGRIYKFTEYDNPYAKVYGNSDLSFSPTEVKNYPVQGFATGDIVPLIIGKLYRRFKSIQEFDDKVYLINTVHDSVLIDCHSSRIFSAVAEARQVMENAPKYLLEEFGIVFDLPLSVGIKVGPDWQNMKEWK